MCLESWLALSDLYLRLPDVGYQKLSNDGSSLVRFVRSFYHERAHADYSDKTLIDLDDHPLQRACYLLVHRLFNGPKPPASFYEFDFISNFCTAHDRNSKAVSKLLRTLWNQSNNLFKTCMESKMKELIKMFDSKSTRTITQDLFSLAKIVRDSPDVALMLMTGSDFLDGLVAQYTRHEDTVQSNGIRGVANLALWQLTKTNPPNMSLLSDHLFSLKASADKIYPQPTLARALATTTGLIPLMKKRFGGAGNERLNKALDQLGEYRSVWQKALDKKQTLYRDDDEMHMHRAGRISQIQELFPHLGSAFIERLLWEYDENPETVTAALLDDALPANLRNADQSAEAPHYHKAANGNVDSLEPRSALPSSQKSFVPERRNVFDDDEFDRLEMDTSKLHIGKRKDITPEGQTNKAAILSALAAFDSDDDERDDTYDMDDVGGTVDTAHPDGEPGPAEREIFNDNDMALFSKYTSAPHIFARTPDARKHKDRHGLKAETRMTDEAIEGWAIMLQRDPKRLRRLEAQFNNFDGKQAAVSRTAFREGVEGTETEESDGPSTRGGFRTGFRGRGRGRGGNVAGADKDPKTGIARERKEASKSSRANHNRRDQRARKMARGGFAG